MQVSGWWASHLQPASVEATLSSMTATCVLPRYKRWCLSGGVKGNGEQEPQALGCLIWHVPLSYKPRTGLFATALGARRPSVGHEKNPSALWPSLRTTALKPLLWTLGVSLIAQLVKNPPAMQETPVRFLDQEDPLEKG